MRTVLIHQRLLVILLLLITTFTEAQSNYPTVINHQILLGKSFNDIKSLNPRYKWFSSNSSSDESSETYLFYKKPIEIYITYSTNDDYYPIIKQTITFWGNKSNAYHYFIAAINSLKRQGGYYKIYDRINVPTVCQLFYSDIKIDVSLIKYKGLNYIVNIDCENNK